VKTLVVVVALAGLLGALLAHESRDTSAVSWTAKERRAIQRLSLASLPLKPRDPSNRVADDRAAAELGHRLFFDRGFSANGRVSCSSCHLPKRGLQDGRPVGRGLGRTVRRTMPLGGVAYATWLFWDGRRDSLWAQALTPLESRVEHRITRTFAARRIATHYRRSYERVFGKLPLLRALPPAAGPLGFPSERRAWRRLTAEQREAVDRVFANLGKAIAAYERTLRPAPGRFDRFAAALARGDEEAAASVLSPAEAQGLKLFVGEAHCTNCHRGSLLTNGAFHNTGVPQGAKRDRGRSDGARAVVVDPFNCLGPFSDGSPRDCTALRFLVRRGPQLSGAFKVPSLRDVASRPPYTHAGHFRTLRDVLEHYRRAPAASVGTSELDPLALSNSQLREIEDFLRTLDGGITAPRGFLKSPGE
jgi:cytochrome c peroxidase